MLLVQTRYWPEVEIQAELKIGREEETYGKPLGPLSLFQRMAMWA